MLEEDSPQTTHLRAVQAALTEVESLQESYDNKVEAMEGEETDERLIAQDEEAYDEFTETLLATKFTIELLISKRGVYKAMQTLEDQSEIINQAFVADPEATTTNSLKTISKLETALIEEVMASELLPTAPLKKQCDAVLKTAGFLKIKLEKKPPTEVKPVTSTTSKTGIKLKYLDVPDFSGKTEDWLSFWRLFKNAVHNNTDLEENIKLTYLIQALKDPTQKATYAERMEEEGAYQSILEELQNEYDKPRWMHRKYCESMKHLETNPHTRAGMKDLISKVTVILKGFVRLKAGNCRQILTSFTESVMDTQLRDLWNQRTDKLKTTPAVENVLLFIKEQADQLEEVAAPSAKLQHQSYKTRPHHKYKGSTNSVVTPAQASSAKPVPQRTSTHPQSRPFSATLNYTCLLCQDSHLLYYCPTFEGYTVAQRKEFAVSKNLCLNCLKPNHNASLCRSHFRCRAKDCQKKHNTLLHEDRSSTTTSVQPQATQQTNAATHSATSEAVTPMTENLLMTSQVILTGPTGVSVTARALLDSASTVFLLSTKMMKILSLEKTNNSVCIEGVGSTATTTNHPISQVTLSSSYKKNWSREITIAGMDKVTRELPLQGASSVRELPYLKNLTLADNNFDKPGKIDILLGQNIWKQLCLPEKVTEPDDQPDAWHTVFGWTIMGIYTPHSHTGQQPALTHATSSTTSNNTTDQLLARFWVVEEPSIYAPAFTPSEQRVEEHFKTTHQYLKEEKRYLVHLPKKEVNLALGESKTQAINRAKANERSLIRKQAWPRFQAVVKEYLELGHAQLVSPTDSQPPSNCYYMPVHAVYKESSSTTKIRAVFDASARSTTQVSLNDLLAVGPTLHPTLDQILLRFRTYAVAISGDITKMYREVLLHPDDQSLHRFIWREDTTADWKAYQMTRVTFGVAASPYLAVKALQQAAQDFGNQMKTAQWHILHSFYVDDLMGGADTVAEATTLYQDLRNILSNASFQLKKWRSSSPAVLKTIPSELQESLPTQDLVDQYAASYPKALGVSWDSRQDTMSTYINLPATHASTKRGIVSDIAKTFDVPSYTPDEDHVQGVVESKAGLG